MNTVDEITAAIQGLSLEQRQELVARLPEVLPEMGGDAKWERIIRDPGARPALSALGDEIEAELATNPEAFPEITEGHYDRHP
jgi:hypothetical protein